MVTHYRHTTLFYILATVFPWSFWFIAGYFSHLDDSYMNLASIFAFIGLLSPVVVAYWLTAKNPELKKDLFSRFFNFKSIKPIYILLTLFLMPISILSAQAVSLLFGYSVSQFVITGNYTFSSGVFPVLFLLIVAPIIEELAWHSYATDALRNRFNLFNTSMIFGLFWGIWHIPLSSINHYYQNNLIDTGWIHGVNFLVSIFPFVIIMNWLYYKTQRNIIVPIIFHITAGYFNEIFATHPDSKVIQTAILIVVAVIIVVKNRPYFFTNRFDVMG
ncbi:MAG: CPBP family intramembrane metalloprotease [Magnetococcales bacterium]|nr:CPBP family intramembrane metalloprotease [Magnetococcales bacterium]